MKTTTDEAETRAHVQISQYHPLVPYKREAQYSNEIDVAGKPLVYCAQFKVALLAQYDLSQEIANKFANNAASVFSYTVELQGLPLI